MKKKTKADIALAKGIEWCIANGFDVSLKTEPIPGWADGYKLGKLHAAEMADVISRNHGASKLFRTRLRKAILKLK